MNLLHPGHGRGKGQPHIELPKLTDLPDGVAAPSGAHELEQPAIDRAPTGRVTAASAAELGRRGGLAKAARAKQVKALDMMGLRHCPQGDLLNYLNDADDFAEHEVARLAECVGGGVCGAGPASMVQSAALALAASRFLFATSEGSASKLSTAAKLAESSRQHLLAAHTLCALEAKSRPSTGNATERALQDILGGK